MGYRQSLKFNIGGIIFTSYMFYSLISAGAMTWFWFGLNALSLWWWCAGLNIAIQHNEEMEEYDEDDDV